MADTTALFSPALMDDPYPLYARLRDQAPVFKLDPPGLWVVSRYEDVLFVLRHPELFSSSRRAVLETLRDPRLEDSVKTMLSGSIIGADPPDHARLRKLINAAFTPRAIAALESRIRDLARELIDEVMRGEDEFDLMEALAVPLPVIVISELLGVDTARRADFKRWSDDLLAGSNFVERLPEAEIERLRKSHAEFFDYFREMIDSRRKAPREDLISDLVRAEVEREMLTADEVLSMALILLIAGNETTTNLLGNGTAELLDRPHDLARLRADPTLIPGFVEEVLRFRSPVTMMVRTAREDVTLAGVTIPKDQPVAALLASANRDPAQFPDPDRFDISRQHAGHVAFGHGIHFCVGAPLSRLEGRIAFEEMFRRLPALTRVPGPLDWHPSPTLRGLRTLRLRMHREAST
ncbi:cytochrome P450 [Nannocystis punicea]|uniref:Cytochrome P450 n=1 Tax=Nannocystis punicea TaxID=2995304 RepID=A0ABY7H8H4_9BACT|nr:cytochrome P450 [Nannocystis poenicansa]WAS95395.1 cytochrome P450 [Nannocystis poenicansa]